MEKWRKVFAVGFAVGACGLALTACSNQSNSSSSGTKKTLNWMEQAEIPSMDISKAVDRVSYEQLNNTMEGLYRLGNNAKIEPGLATKTEESKDGKTWTFTLRKNSKWSNGDPVTAKDFVYSWRRTVNPKTASEYSYLFSGVKNADAIVAGKKPVSSLGVKAEGNYKLVVNLDKRIPYFKLLMGFPLFYPQNENAVKKFGKNYAMASKYNYYNGPFVQKGWNGSNLTWKLEKNPNYWDKKNVKLNTINYSVQKTPSTAYNEYQSGKLDAAVLNAQGTKQLKNQKGYTIRKMASTQYLQLNMQRNPDFKNEKLRRAFSMAINRNNLTNTIGGANQPATTFSAEDMVKVNGKDYTNLVKDNKTKNVMSYNPSNANKVYQQALNELGKKKLSFTILSDDDDTSKKAAEFLQSQLESNLDNLDVNVQSIPKKTRLNRAMKGDFDAVLTGWIADFSDPISFLDLETTKNSYNFGKWSNSQYDKLVANSKTTSSENERWNNMKDAERVLLEKQGVTPLYHPEEAWMVRPSVKGVVFNGAGAPYSFKNAYVAN